MSKTSLTVILVLAVSILWVACQEKYSTLDDVSVLTVSGIPIQFIELTVEGASIQFIREKPPIPEGRVYRDGEAQGILTLQDNCFRLDQDGPVIIWPSRFIPHINDGVVEVHDAKGELMARVGDHLEIAGGALKRDTGNCSGPTWVDTRRAEKPTLKTPSWPSPDDPPINP